MVTAPERRDEMTNEEIRTGFNQMIEAATLAGDMDAVAKFELAREHCTNPAFRRALQDYVWQINGAGQ
jgi:hypothetical protein